MTRILSIDPGIKNLSYCLVNTEPLGIVEWDTLSITESNCKKIRLEEIVESLLIVLNEKFNEEFEVDVILIENQPALLNGHMKTISVVIYTYFTMMKLQYGMIGDINFLSATNKLKCNKGTGLKLKTYKDRKKESIEIAKLYIEEYFPDKMEWFKALKKCDDASDTLNMIIYYLENELKMLSV
jgi:hypothetical protein